MFFNLVMRLGAVGLGLAIIAVSELLLPIVVALPLAIAIVCWMLAVTTAPWE